MRGILSLCRTRAPRAVLKFKITFEREAKVTSANAGGDLNSHPFHDRTTIVHHHPSRLEISIGYQERSSTRAGLQLSSNYKKNLEPLWYEFTLPSSLVYKSEREENATLISIIEMYIVSQNTSYPIKSPAPASHITHLLSDLSLSSQSSFSQPMWT